MAQCLITEPFHLKKNAFMETSIVKCIIDTLQFENQSDDSSVLTMGLAELYIWSIMHEQKFGK